MSNEIEISMETQHHSSPYSANTYQSYIDHKLNKSVQTTNFFWASLTSKLIIKWLASPFYRVQTIIQCQKETFLNSNEHVKLKIISNCQLKSNTVRPRPVWVL